VFLLWNVNLEPVAHYVVGIKFAAIASFLNAEFLFRTVGMFNLSMIVTICILLEIILLCHLYML
jgi:hypothetical protein